MQNMYYKMTWIGQRQYIICKLIDKFSSLANNFPSNYNKKLNINICLNDKQNTL